MRNTDSFSPVLTQPIFFCYTKYVERLLNCTPFVRQYDILSNKWGVLLCQKEYQTNGIRRNSKKK